ncbi:alkylation response protein AidB-like acyl-CoA dehydrogenase [Virgibacillus natechei]|uniref:Alkylation response protein AidB-like acyl-CoA dehydrogenase n=1 Tax=Virgibacillus natechei TaxID=1216297 RepID=A0ABS4IIE5_9BACI|nr:acyl-CoA dehydrogenase family protein [Virgibacillus natechei]MBP1970697.1 alkylation response protein AidB-like acyl-CoA dehydrogenase [Virgibacillus natechei]UZD12058.1 acyl-CoA/acyl-ACP dehydrogenase [Virgibacillus natechei]
MKLTEYKSTTERMEALQNKVAIFSDRAKKYDEEASFPFENFNELKEIGYPALTVPKEFGGLGISLYEMLFLQEIIAKADGSTALSIGWHMGITKHLGENKIWKKEKYKAYARDVIEKGALLNNAASEPATGSPTRGGKPETVAKKEGSGWGINGRKTFTTLAPILDYFVVSASIDGTDNVGNFLVKSDREGVSVDETWDSIAMRGSGSHDLVLENVHVDADDLVENITPGNKDAAGWLLHIPACYLGIARAAQAYAVDFAASYSPNSIEGTISELPNVKQKLGEMELLLMESEHFLYSVARKWDESDDGTRQTMKPELGAVKLSVVNKAVEVVDLAMRVAGARSLSKQNPLQRYYRDVRAGLHNPPMDDMTVMQLAGKSVAERG